MAMNQNMRSVHNYAADFENCIARFTSYDEAMLLQMFLWGLDKPNKI